MLRCLRIYAILLVIFHIALFDLRTAACKLSTNVGGPTYFLISFTSSRVRGDGERENIPVAPFLSTSSTPLLLSGISTGSSRAINKRTRRSSRIAYRCMYPPTFRLVSFSSRSRTRPDTRQFRDLFALGFPEQVLKYLALRMSLNRAAITRQEYATSVPSVVKQEPRNRVNCNKYGKRIRHHRAIPA